ncbi:MAG: acyl-CoA dehydrogenase family protein [Candidatus Dormibacteria bacterium]
MSPRFDDLAVEAARRFRSGSDTGLVAANLNVARELGLPALTVPVAKGGMGANLLEFASYQQHLARGDGATALVLAMHHMLVGGEAETARWPADPWDQLCHAAVNEGALVNSAATEPGAGSPSQGGLPLTRAYPAPAAAPAPSPGAGWRLSGRKAYTTGAPFLACMRVSARVQGEAEKPHGARFLVRLPASGLRIEDSWQPAALGGAANADVLFEDTPATFLYREDARGCEGTAWFQVAIAATYLGIGFAAHEAAVEFTRHRVTAAGPVSERESVQLRLGRSRASLEVGRRNLLATCGEWVDRREGSADALLPDIGLAKVTAVGAAAAAAEEAVRLVGAGGFGASQPFARWLLETRAGLSHPPIEDVTHLSLARRDLAGPGEGATRPG